MSAYLAGFLISFVTSVVLLTLFSYEERKGKRICANLRTHLDLYVLQVLHMVHRFIDLFGKNSVRQLAHYIFHSFLKTVLYLNKRWENAVRNMMRVNKTLARNAAKERTERNKLEEIALYKTKNALTEEEKKKYKDKMLQGD